MTVTVVTTSSGCHLHNDGEQVWSVCDCGYEGHHWPYLTPDDHALAEACVLGGYDIHRRLWCPIAELQRAAA